MINFGNKIYKSRSTKIIKALAIFSSVFLLLNLYFQTFNDPVFSKQYGDGFLDVLKFHIKYPYDLLSYLFFIFIPSLYYGFIRGNTFYENVVVINKGFPFYNRAIDYNEIEGYEIIHARLMVAIKLKESSTKYVFGVSDVDRVLSIFDKNSVAGDLEDQDTIKLTINSMVMIFILLTALSVAIGQTGLNLSRFLFR